MDIYHVKIYLEIAYDVNTCHASVKNMM